MREIRAGAIERLERGGGRVILVLFDCISEHNHLGTLEKENRPKVVNQKEEKSA